MSSSATLPSHGHKRPSRSSSANGLLAADEPLQKRAQQNPAPECASLEPLLPHLSESKAGFFRRLSARLRRDVLSPAHAFDRDGIYLYKRAVRSGEGTGKAALLAAAGSVFRHVVVYVREGDQLSALEYGPANGFDITDNLSVDTPPGPVLLRPAPPPEPHCLPMLHIAAPHHPLGAAHVRQALAHAQAGAYNALRSNCIAFADFVVRVLTGGAVRGAPLLFDALVGQVPPVDSPLLGLLSLMQLRWHDVCDGSRMLRAFLPQLPGGVLPPVPGAQRLPPLLGPPAAGEDEAAVAAVARDAAAATAAPALDPSGFASLLASFLPPQAAPAAAAAAPAPADSDSSGSEDTCAVAPASLAAASSASCPAASEGDSLAPRGGLKGLPLPARRGGRVSRVGSSNGR